MYAYFSIIYFIQYLSIQPSNIVVRINIERGEMKKQRNYTKSEAKMIKSNNFIHGYISIYVAMYISIYLSIYLSMYLCIYVSMYLSFYL